MKSGFSSSMRLEFGGAVVPYMVGWRCTGAILGVLADLEPDSLIVVTDTRVEQLLDAGLLAGFADVAPVVRCTFPPGESMKTLGRLEECARLSLSRGVTRRSVVVTVGGGVPGNLGGFLAATLFRGIRLVHIPTTILAAMDSVVSLKQAVNSPFGKNLLGAYHAPSRILVDLAHFQTLPHRELLSGLGEIAKNCLAIRPESLARFRRIVSADPLDRSALDWLLGESIAAKMHVMAADPREQHAALILEYGHTIGHALETVALRKKLEPPPHGEAVVHGMLVASALAKRLDLMDSADVQAHIEVAELLGIGQHLPDYAEPGELLATAMADNKRGHLPLDRDSLAMVLLKGLGRPNGDPALPLTPVQANDLKQVLVGRCNCRAMPAPAMPEHPARAEVDCPVEAHTEWDPLEEVIVGRIEGARIPRAGRDLLATEFADFAEHPEDVPSGPFPEALVSQTAADLALLVDALEGLGVRVRRPEVRKTEAEIATPDWRSEGFYDYCPRDGLLTVGNAIIETPMVLRSRFLEPFAYKSLLIEYADRGANWVSAPKPRLADGCYDPSAPLGARLQNHEPIFDAANVLKLGTDLLYLVSDSGNSRGAVWLQRLLGDRYTVHRCHNLYASTHIDSTIVPLRAGLVLLNPARVNDDNLPPLLRNWDKIWAPDLIETPFIGQRPYCSKWIGMNLLMVRPDLAIVDDRQPDLIRLIRRHGIEVLPLRLTHARSLGGGFHCVTLDVRRRGPLECYR